MKCCDDSWKYIHGTAYLGSLAVTYIGSSKNDVTFVGLFMITVILCYVSRRRSIIRMERL